MFKIICIYYFPFYSLAVMENLNNDLIHNYSKNQKIAQMNLVKIKTISKIFLTAKF